MGRDSSLNPKNGNSTHEFINTYTDSVIQEVMKYTLKAQIKLLEELLKKNAQFCPEPKYSQYNLFIHGHFHSLNAHIREYGRIPGRLHHSFNAEGDHYLLLDSKMHMDSRLLRQHFSVLLRGCANHQDIRDTLPDFAKPDKSLQINLPRTREEAYAHLDNPKRMNQYKQAKDILYYNLGNKVFS